MSHRTGTHTARATTAAVLLALGGWAAAQDRPAETRHAVTLSAEEAFELGMGASGVQRDPRTGHIVLFDNAVVEDDGPGVSTTVTYIDEADRLSVEDFSETMLIKKVLRVPRPQAMGAQLYVRPDNSPVTLNGQPLELKGRYAAIPPSLLKAGDNEFVYGRQGAGKLCVARMENILRNAPERKEGFRRSFRSADGGKTWQAIEGECLVRLILRQYAEEGSFVSPVVDLGRGRDAAGPVLPRAAVRSAAVKYDGLTPEGTSIELLIRTGPGPVHDPELWTDWTADGSKLPAGHRFGQWKAILRTNNPLASPALKSVTVEAQVAAQPAPDWAQALRVIGFHNERIRYSSMPFEYEDPFHPRLVELRRKYKLDEVVSGSHSEFERLLKLKNWVSKQWKYKPPEGRYPAWDAEEIMTRKLGFCVQYAIVFIQCAGSLGHPARFVFGDHPGIMGGHEVSEVWSNEFRKWIVLDSNGNRHYLDPNTGEPLSMLEVHARMIRHYYGQKPATPENKPKEPSYAPDLVSAHGLEMTPPVLGEAKPKSWPAWTKWLTLHYVPRNNFYSKPAPLPIAQGWGWDWPYYWCWYDQQTPRKPRYHFLTARPSDLEWTLNQVCFAAEYADQPGAIAVQMGTFTPFFQTYLVRRDGGEWEKADRRLTWRLHAGRNRLEMRVRNTAGVEGPISHIELDYAQPQPR